MGTDMADAIAVLNAGSSSFKFSLFADNAQGIAPVARGQAESLYTSPRFVAKDGTGKTLDEKSWGEGVSLGHSGALDYLVAFLRQRLTEQPDAGCHGIKYISLHKSSRPDAPRGARLQDDRAVAQAHDRVAREMWP